MLIEYVNETEREAALKQFIGIKDRVFIQVEGHPREEAPPERLPRS